MSQLLIWQLCDSAFPSGGFAHSGGLEAATQLGELTAANARDFLLDVVAQQAQVSLPFVMTAWRTPEQLVQLDQACDAFLSAQITNRASRATGQGWLAAVVKAFETPALVELREQARQHKWPLHHAPVFGACAKALALSDANTAQLYLFLQLRGALSAAVRLNVIGPLEAQAITYALHSTVAELAENQHHWNIAHVAQCAPLLELFASHHDRLYSRLFQS